MKTALPRHALSHSDLPKPGDLCPLVEPGKPPAPFALMALVLRSDVHSLLLAPVHCEVPLATEEDVVCRADTSSLQTTLVVCLSLARSFPLAAAGAPKAHFAATAFKRLATYQAGDETSAHPEGLIPGLHLPPQTEEGKQRNRLVTFWNVFRGAAWEKAVAELAYHQPPAGQKDLTDLAHLLPRIASLAESQKNEKAVQSSAGMRGKGSAMKAKGSSLGADRKALRVKTELEYATIITINAPRRPHDQVIALLHQLGLDPKVIDEATRSGDWLAPLPHLFALLKGRKK